ncbi:MAG: 4Fe-4S binding protein [Bacteroidaceae bacterium]
MMKNIEHIIGLLVVTLMLVAVAIRRDGTILGHPVVQETTTTLSDAPQASLPSGELCEELKITDASQLKSISPNSWSLPDGHILYSTELLGKDIIGYAGNTPLFVLTKDLQIIQVVCGPNSESLGFLRKVQRKGLFNQWNGKTFTQADELHVDGVSGATFTSKAVIGNMEALIPIMNADKTPEQHALFSIKLDTKQFVSLFFCLLVLLFGIATATFLKGKRWRMVQLILNVGVLGFWTGSFISLPLLVGWLSHSPNLSSGIVILLILVLAIVMPFVGKKSYYCTYVCPFGAAQELMGRIGPKPLKIPARLMTVLRHTRQVITLILFLFMWTGITFDLINYEVFSAFLFDQASVFVLVLAVVSLLLSLVVSRPYCRFVCPTGQLLKWSEGRK